MIIKRVAYCSPFLFEVIKEYFYTNTFMSIRLTLLAIGILLTCTGSLAQNSIWKKNMERTIHFKQTEVKRPDSLLNEMLIDAVLKEQVQAYLSYDAFFTSKLAATQLAYALTTKYDTITIIDPETHKDTIVVIARMYQPELTNKYKLHEEWTFDANKCKTTIHILGIAPALDIFREDGSYRATQPLFWLKYPDVSSLIAQYDNMHTQKFSNAVWFDYIKDTAAQSNVKLTGTYTTQTTRIVHILYPEDTIHYHLYDISPDTCYMESIIDLIKAGKINAYNDNTMKTQLSEEEVMKIFTGTIDTVMEIHPETNSDVVIRDVFNFCSITKFMLLEDWSFDAKKGETTIQINAIAPLHDTYYDDGSFKEISPVFWIKFDDFLKILPAYDTYHPTNTFAEKLWQSYFQTPEYVH